MKPRGGRRPGAGRPLQFGRRVTVRIEKQLLDMADSQRLRLDLPLNRMHFFRKAMSELLARIQQGYRPPEQLTDQFGPRRAVGFNIQPEELRAVQQVLGEETGIHSVTTFMRVAIKEMVAEQQLRNSLANRSKRA